MVRRGGIRVAQEHATLKRKRLSSKVILPVGVRIKTEDEDDLETFDRAYSQNGSSLVTLLTDRHTHPRVSGLLRSYLDITDIVALTRVCRSLSSLYTDSLPHDWDINSRLVRFVSDPNAFRRVLGNNRALIVGSIPVQFFDRLRWDDSSLDILVQQGTQAGALKTHLRRQGYQNQATRLVYAEVLEYKITPWSKAGSQSVVNIITAQGFATWAFLTGLAFSTVNACFISWDIAYCLFPRYTFIEHKIKLAYGLEDTYSYCHRLLLRYVLRGWGLGDDSAEQNPDTFQECKNALQGLRRIGDAETWSIPLDCTGISNIEVNRTVTEKCTFGVTIHKNNTDPEARFRINTGPFECCILKHKYTFDTMDYPEDDFHGYLRYTLCRRAAIEIKAHLAKNTLSLSQGQVRRVLETMSNAKEDDTGECDDRCPLLFSRDSKGGFTRPPKWQYADYLIPEIYASWLQGQPQSRLKRKIKDEVTEESEDERDEVIKQEGEDE
ncbi:hypothetical protein E4T47_04784 [Aureobasidium subglaciale]|nr:hypothetical protein E4T47_04784 [Aureobasidium subglaciale]